MATKMKRIYFISASKGVEDTSMHDEGMCAVYNTSSWLKKVLIIAMHRLLGAEIKVSIWKI